MTFNLSKIFLWALASSFVFCILLAPQETFAKIKLEQPDYAVPISEEDFSTLESLSCYFTRHCYGMPLLDKLNGFVVSREGENDEMYFILKAFRNASLDDTYRTQWYTYIEPFLPDGFYKSGKEYFWIADGHKTLLTKGEAFAQFIERLERRNETFFGREENVPTEASFPVSEIEFDELLLDCNELKRKFADERSAPGSLGVLSLCDVGKIEGVSELSDSGGKVYRRTEHENEIYFVIPYKQYVYKLDKKVNQHSFFYFVQHHSFTDQAERVGAILFVP